MSGSGGILAWLARRLAAVLVVLWGTSLVAFSLQIISPGDPAELILRTRYETPAPEKVAQLRQRMGLDRPAIEQYLAWLGRVARLDLGRSYRTGEPVSREIAARLPATLELALAAFALVVGLSVLLGLAAAWRRTRWLDRLLQPVGLGLVSLPSYWLALLLIALFALDLGWLPVAGFGGPATLVLPALTLGLGVAAMQGRVLRVKVLEALGQDYLRFALAKGLGRGRIVLRHLLPNTLVPMITLWGMSLGSLLGGVVVVETIFAWPGLGRLLVEALLNRDLPLVQGVVLLMALLFIGSSLLADLLQRLLDPRLAGEGTHG
ncbi:MAG: ABC transporter permease [Desulfarculaceae bacterium]|nr:ABC transporter permease [Desulfarculaceae bacterium]MCF8073221.1 ABC transporter permease [Desulfarculaceae bacterium]MCF8100817.1 ABC transporter permease [Desulfarculaceae bacterium]MCF8117745.1 ABC transporter permease [Desulfarculaceae bacterium]